MFERDLSVMAIKTRGRDKGDDAEEGDLFLPIGEVLRKLKQGPMNFGVYQTGDKGRPVVLAAHKRKDPEMLAKQAKKEAGTPKGAFGTVTLEGGELVFQCLPDQVPGSLIKNIRLMLKSEGFSKFKARVLLPGGEELGETDEGEEAAGAEGDRPQDGAGPVAEGGGNAQDDGAVPEWDALRPALEAASASGDGRHALQAAKLLKMMDAIVQAGDGKKARAVLPMVEKLLAEAGPADAAPDDQQQRRRRAVNELELGLLEKELAMLKRLLA